MSGHANVTGVPWRRSGGSHVLAVKTVAVRVTPGLARRGDPGGGACVDDFGHGGLDRVHTGHGVGARRENPDALGPDDEHPGLAHDLLRGGAVEHVRRADEVGDESVGRVLVDVAGLADLFDAAVVEHGQPVAQGQRLVLVVGDDDEGDADFALDRLQLELHLFAQFEIQRAERLVEQQHPRPPDERPRQRHALTFVRPIVVRGDAAQGRSAGPCRAHRRCDCRRSAFGTPRTFSPYSTFCATVMCGNSAYSWKTVLTSRLRAGSAVTSAPPSLIVPAVGCSNPAIIRSTVVLPEPDGPRIANSSPSPTARSAPSTATRSPNSFLTPISSICGSSTAAATFVSECGLTVPEGMAHRMNSAVKAQPLGGFRGRGRDLRRGSTSQRPARSRPSRSSAKDEPQALTPAFAGNRSGHRENLDTDVTSGVAVKSDAAVVPCGSCPCPGATCSNTSPPHRPCSASAPGCSRSRRRWPRHRRPRRRSASCSTMRRA